MRAHEIENWALQVINAVNKSQPNEDSRVELKREWPEAQKAARRIAGHANAASGEPILWLIGVDEEKGVIGAENNEMSTWFSQVKAEFAEDVYPALTSINIPVDGLTVVSLLFETERAPFVVKNPSYKKPDGGDVRFEVPWREGTSVRSARHTDLIRVLSPLQRLPRVEALQDQGELSYGASKAGNQFRLSWNLRLSLYWAPPSGSNRFSVPFHKCEASFSIEPTVISRSFDRVDIVYSDRSPFVAMTGHEIVFSGPGKTTLNAAHNELSDAEFEFRQGLMARVTAKLWINEADRAVLVNAVVPLVVG